MAASIGPILILWCLLLPSGGQADPGPGTEALSTSLHAFPNTITSDPRATIEAMPPGLGWPWRYSEVGTTEEETDDGDDLGPVEEDLSRRRSLGDRDVTSPIRPDRGSFRSPFRSPILRC